MDVFGEILEWSRGRPGWQRDALRRLAAKGTLDDDDIAELAELCKGPHGLSSPQEPRVLEKKHLPKRGVDIGGPVTPSL